MTAGKKLSDLDAQRSGKKAHQEGEEGERLGRGEGKERDGGEKEKEKEKEARGKGGEMNERRREGLTLLSPEPITAVSP